MKERSCEATLLFFSFIPTLITWEKLTNDG